MGTIGAVAVDLFGNVAAATSTGGMTNKKYGRVGDSPLIGAGTYYYYNFILDMLIMIHALFHVLVMENISYVVQLHLNVMLK